MKEIEVSSVMPYLYRPEKPVRTAKGPDGEPWFVLSDLCAVLDIKNVAQARNRLDPEEVAMTQLAPTQVGARTATIVSEPGMYELVLSSRTPEAQALKRWLTHEVLPSIRQTGQYLTTEARELHTDRRTELAYTVRSMRRTAERYPEAAAAILRDVRALEDGVLYGWMESLALPDSNRRIREIAPPNT